VIDKNVWSWLNWSVWTLYRPSASDFLDFILPKKFLIEVHLVLERIAETIVNYLSIRYTHSAKKHR
jgi:hypothetical protein